MKSSELGTLIFKTILKNSKELKGEDLFSKLFVLLKFLLDKFIESEKNHFTTFFLLNVGKIYLNGILNNTKTYTSETVSYYNQEIWIGKSNFANGIAKGNFSSVKFYNKVLTDNQVLQNYNALKGRFGL